MIKFNDRFRVTRDTYGWALIETTTAIDRKTKKEKPKDVRSYYPKLDQVCSAMIDRMAGDCEDLEELRQMLIEVPKQMAQSISVQFK